MTQRPRIYYSEAQKALMWDRWKAGDTLHEMGCCRFQRHLVKVEDETGGGLWERDGSSAGNSRLKRSSW